MMRDKYMVVANGHCQSTHLTIASAKRAAAIWVARYAPSPWACDEPNPFVTIERVNHRHGGMGSRSFWRTVAEWIGIILFAVLVLKCWHH